MPLCIVYPFETGVHPFPICYAGDVATSKSEFSFFSFEPFLEFREFWSVAKWFMSNPFDSIPEEHRQVAEQVAAYLVNVRGGAMFVWRSVRLLAQWRWAIPVPAILCAIDKVSEKRRANRVKRVYLWIVVRVP